MDIFSMILCLIISITGCLSTFWAAEKFQWGSVKSSALITLIYSMIIYGINHIYPINIKWYLSVFYGSTFVGMASKKVFSFINVLFSGIIYALIFRIFSPYFNNIGGTLGTAACISCIIVYLVQKIRL